MEDRRLAGLRRQSDALLAEHIKKDERLQSEILSELTEIKAAIKSMTEVLSVFNTLKGGWTTTKWGVAIILGLAAVIGAMTSIKYAFNMWFKS